MIYRTFRDASSTQTFSYARLQCANFDLIEIIVWCPLIIVLISSVTSSVVQGLGCIDIVSLLDCS